MIKYIKIKHLQDLFAFLVYYEPIDFINFYCFSLINYSVQISLRTSRVKTKSYKVWKIDNLILIWLHITAVFIILIMGGNTYNSIKKIITTASRIDGGKAALPEKKRLLGSTQFCQKHNQQGVFLYYSGQVL